MRRVAVCLVLFLASVACGGGSSPSAPTAVSTPRPTRSEVAVTFSPVSPVATPNTTSTSDTWPWRVDYTIVLKESNGLGGNVNYVNTSFTNTFGFSTRTDLNYGADRIIAAAGTNHLTGGGELRIPLSMVYSADGFGGRAMTLKVAINFTDDLGSVTSLGGQANVVSVDQIRF